MCVRVLVKHDFTTKAKCIVVYCINIQQVLVNLVENPDFTDNVIGCTRKALLKELGCETSHIDLKIRIQEVTAGSIILYANTILICRVFIYRIKHKQWIQKHRA